ncbi:hypothetical protein BVE84_01795 [Streptococcus azizii]|uniref:DUF3165 domain-containing protein n=1 Tax=Streptococcus azizii TaxID=1579424 RepID=A0AB36JU02_9STRE|nr:MULTISPECIES: DUF3165 family protein [Streptococcus]MBF0775262.1 DUF3165 family protein [Streptococcus sp. 19428wD3_AN2]ONK29536.1 hypothetical protein BVE86_00485 [Streptococcus azizii]ONK30045.1 hypothetical protein BVE85_01795 [Streptococcus azizii]ONK30821.1 hypothetical protein BVE84_01795 [Streptococcus azizii]TFU84789.1 DUF3165 family protein [Streptococcus sp. AN2]
MFYLILAIMLVLFYIFVAPSNIKGTMNVVAAVFVVVGLLITLLLGFLRILQSPPEMWLVAGMVMVGLWAMRDIYFLDKAEKTHVTSRRRPYRYR